MKLNCLESKLNIGTISCHLKKPLEYLETYNEGEKIIITTYFCLATWQEDPIKLSFHGKYNQFNTNESPR